MLLTLNLFYFAGLTLNILTLAGLALGFGMLVDNAIVVIDNIHHMREQGFSAAEAALRGAREVIAPLLAATLTTVVVLVPFYFLKGDLQVYYLPFATAVMLSLLASLFVALLFTPAMAARIAPATQTRASRLNHFYRRILERTNKRPWLVCFAVALLAWFFWYQFNENVTIGSIWNWGDSTYLRCYARLPKGAQLQRSDDIARSFEEKVVGLQGVKRVQTTVTSGYMSVRIDFDKKTAASAYPLILKDQLSVHASHFAGVSIGVIGFGPGYHSGFGGSAANFRIKVLGYSYQDVKNIAEAVGRRLSRNARIREVNTSGSGKWWGGSNQTETVLTLKRERLSRHGLAVPEVFDQLSAYLRENQQRRQIMLDKERLAYRVKFADFAAISCRTWLRW